ncbi:MAG: acetyl-CoA carboxylase carboxyltransferase subunit alpha [Phycisphaerae bacterium]|nr:acetyl-CoA carboxylase carboxyltransferase subunit alpha [Phycisphaerae bacterium]
MAQAEFSASVGTSARTLLEFEKPIHRMEEEIRRLEASQAQTGRDYSDVINQIRQQLVLALRETFSKLTPWEKVLVARHPQRPLLRDYIRLMTKDFCELHGDRLFGDDKALVCGFARIPMPGGKLEKVMLIGHQKGRDTRERIEVNFGCAHPEGYRKALRMMKMAEKFGLPIVCLVDTPGAYPGVGAEERGIASAIAVNLMEMSRLKTPIVAAVIGEGGSGGALGIAVADRVGVMEHAYYSVISPEGGAAILWKSGEHAPKAAEALRLTPAELLRLKLIDDVITEPLGGAHRDPASAARMLGDWIGSALVTVRKGGRSAAIAAQRYTRVRGWGSFFENRPQPVEAPVIATSERAPIVVPA